MFLSSPAGVNSWPSSVGPPEPAAPARVDVVFFPHPGDEGQDEVHVVILLVVVGHVGQLRAPQEVGFRTAEHALHLPDAGLMGVREGADEPLPVRHHGPGGVDGVAPAGHEAAVAAHHQRHRLRAVVVCGDVLIPAIGQAVGQDPGLFQQALRIGLGVVAILVHHHVAALDGLRQVVPVFVVGRARPQYHVPFHSQSSHSL